MYRWIGTVIPELIYMEGAEEVLEMRGEGGWRELELQLYIGC